MRKILLLIFAVSSAVPCLGQASQNVSEAGTFTNPLFQSGADPWIMRHKNYYYYCSSAGNGIMIRRGKNLDDLRDSNPVRVWTAPEGTMWSKEIWAPELHFLEGNWYVYFAADDGKNKNHRMYVIENLSADPLTGTWTLKGKVSDRTDRWAIDGTVFRYRSSLYMVWSGWAGDVNGQQNLYMASMKNPWSISSERVLISAPELPWETVGNLNNPNDVSHVNVNEGPAALIRKGRLFIVYSASGCWTEAYCLGILTFRGSGDLLNPASWIKSTEPVLTGRPEAGAFATGHNSFFRSPDGKEDWIVYHANPAAGQGCGRFRSPRAQKFTWKADGTPDFGEPVSTGVPVILPSEKRRR